jgi:hypothetical protein
LKQTLLTVRKVAEELDRCSDFVRDEMSKKRLAYHKIGGRYYIATEDLADYVNRSRVAAFGERRAKKSKDGAAR